MYMMCAAVAITAHSILPPNLRMNRSRSHFACAGVGLRRVASCSAMLSMKSRSLPWNRKLVGGAMLRDLLPAVAVDPAVDAGREHADRLRGESPHCGGHAQRPRQSHPRTPLS